MLHDIGMSVDYDDHHKHSRYLILNGGLPGFSPVEIAIIAQAARYHRKGMPVPGPLAPLFGEGDAERLDRCAVLLRLAEDLERSRDQLVRRTTMALQQRRGRAAPDRRRRAGRAALGGRPRDRAVRARLPPRPVGRRLSAGATARLRRLPRSAAASARSRPRAVVEHEAERRDRGSCQAAGGTWLQARSTAAVARLPPRLENSPAEHHVARFAARRRAARARGRRAPDRCRCSRRARRRRSRAGSSARRCWTASVSSAQREPAPWVVT